MPNNPNRTALADASAPQPPASIPLYRSEAVERQTTQWMGPVVVARPLSQSLFAGFALLVVLCIVAFVTWGEFTRKAKVNGWLVPQLGLVRVIATQPGTVVSVKVREGQTVAAGTPLAVISAEVQSSALGGTQAEIARQMARRRSSLESEGEQQAVLTKQQRKGVARRIKALKTEIASIDSEIEAVADRQRLAETSAKRLSGLQSQGFVSTERVQQQQELGLEQRAKVRSLERSRAELKREIVTLEAERDAMPLRAQLDSEGRRRTLASLNQEVAQTEAQRELVVTAPQAGVVTAIQVSAGSNASAATPLMSIVPSGTQLDAQLFGPSRAIGFVQPGQAVRLRYQAFPYQKFGHFGGTVEAISGTALSPSDLPPQLAGMSGLVNTTEPLYRIVVHLDRQDLRAYGRDYALQPGMQLEADVLLETRKLYEWALEPLFTLTGRL